MIITIRSYENEDGTWTCEGCLGESVVFVSRILEAFSKEEADAFCKSKVLEFIPEAQFNNLN